MPVFHKRRIRAVHDRLRRVYGDFEPKPRLPILDELVLTILSQHTSDTNRDRAFASLRERFPTWEEVASAPEAAIADAIRSGGLAERKASSIKRVLEEVTRREGSLDLGRLATLPDGEVEDACSSIYARRARACWPGEKLSRPRASAERC